jgi:hypothetical protein
MIFEQNKTFEARGLPDDHSVVVRHCKEHGWEWCVAVSEEPERTGW